MSTYPQQGIRDVPQQGVKVPPAKYICRRGGGRSGPSSEPGARPRKELDGIFRSMAGCDAGTHAIVTLSIGARPFVPVTRPLLELYAAKTNATLHIVESLEHPALAPHRGRLERTLRFLKLPLLAYFLERHARVLFLDDDIVLSPATPDLFAGVPCDELGAVVEQHKPQGWHAQHWRSACEFYKVPRCEPKRWQLFNSGVMLLSRGAHLPLVAGWASETLTCRVLCDQLFFNAAVRRAQLALHDLGATFNFVGSELRRALTGNISDPRWPRGSLAAQARRAALRDACVLHLTRKIPKLYSAHWVAQRSLRSRDVLQCGPNASWPRGRWRAPLLRRLPPLEHKYDIGKEMCTGQAAGCLLLPAWATLADGEPLVAASRKRTQRRTHKI